MFEIDILAQGQIARYDRDIEGFATTMSKRGEVVDFIVEGEYVEPELPGVGLVKSDHMLETLARLSVL